MNPVIATFVGAIFGAFIASGGDDNEGEQSDTEDAYDLFEGNDMRRDE